MEEYSRICAEIGQNAEIVSKAFALAITATAAFLALGFKSKRKSWLFFLIPFLILIPSLWFITTQLESTVQLATYISTCLETKDPSLNWETHLLDHRNMGVRRSITDYTSPDIFYTLSISSIYAVLGIACLIPAYLRVKQSGSGRQSGWFFITSSVLVLSMALVINKTCHVLRPKMFETYIKYHSDNYYTNPLKPTSKVQVIAGKTLNMLLKEEDMDWDRKITIKDLRLRSGVRGDGRFMLFDVKGVGHTINGTYPLSNLLQELAIQKSDSNEVIVITGEKIYESPVGRISRRIRNYYWDSLTRQIDVKNLSKVVIDEKNKFTNQIFLYYPPNDSDARKHFSAAPEKIGQKKLVVKSLPPPPWKDFKCTHGLLTLKLDDGVGVPYVVPGGRFNEMYGWDSYFEALGLIEDDRLDLAAAMVENFIYEIEHYGKILNGNRTYYLTRSQPPFLTSMALAVYEAYENKGALETDRLRRAFIAAIQEYHYVWMDKDHLMDDDSKKYNGLSKYYGSGDGQPPEVEEGHFANDYRQLYKYLTSQKIANLNEPARRLKEYIEKHDVTVAQLEMGYLIRSESDASRQHDKYELLDDFHKNDRAMRESGHDKSYRWSVDKETSDGKEKYLPSILRDRCADFVTVDLNCLLYKYECDIAYAIDSIFNGSLDIEPNERGKSKYWKARASKRKKAILDAFWDKENNLFYDYNHNYDERHDYVTAVTFYPLWACRENEDDTRILKKEARNEFVREALKILEKQGGLVASAKESLESVKDRNKDKKEPIKKYDRQWDYPYGWAPHQMIAWKGLIKNGFEEDAHRLIYRWLYMITKNAKDYNGTIPEKFDVVNCPHDVFAEYGNVGTKFDYITNEGFGWMNASYQVGLSLLPAAYRQKLEKLVPPEDLFKDAVN